jgi:hypothetical protein
LADGRRVKSYSNANNYGSQITVNSTSVPRCAIKASLTNLKSKMKKIFIVTMLIFLTGCVTAPDLDLSRADSVCSQRCSSEYSACTTGFKLFPLVAQAHCNESLKICVSSCSVPQASVGSSPIAQKLVELNSLYKQGLISEKEYEAKKQDILKMM